MCKFANLNNAGVVELVDTLDLGSSASRRESSSLSIRTKIERLHENEVFFCLNNLGE